MANKEQPVPCGVIQDILRWTKHLLGEFWCLLAATAPQNILGGDHCAPGVELHLGRLVVLGQRALAFDAVRCGGSDDPPALPHHSGHSIKHRSLIKRTGVESWQCELPPQSSSKSLYLKVFSYFFYPVFSYTWWQCQWQLFNKTHVLPINFVICSHFKRSFKLFCFLVSLLLFSIVGFMFSLLLCIFDFFLAYIVCFFIIGFLPLVCGEEVQKCLGLPSTLFGRHH